MDPKTIIDRLGGPSKVADLITGESGEKITPQAVSQWYGKTKEGEPRRIPKGWVYLLRRLHPEAFEESPTKGKKRKAKA